MVQVSQNCLHLMTVLTRIDCGKWGSLVLKVGNERNADGEFRPPSSLPVSIVRVLSCSTAQVGTFALKPGLTLASLRVCGRMIPSVGSSLNVKDNDGKVLCIIFPLSTVSHTK